MSPSPLPRFLLVLVLANSVRQFFSEDYKTLSLLSLSVEDNKGKVFHGPTEVYMFTIFLTFLTKPLLLLLKTVFKEILLVGFFVDTY